MIPEYWGYLFYSGWMALALILPDRYSHAMNFVLATLVFALTGTWWWLPVLYWVGYAFRRSMIKYYNRGEVQ